MIEWDAFLESPSAASASSDADEGPPTSLGNLPKILSDLGVGVVVWDDEVPVYVSPIFSEIIGYTPEDLGVRRLAQISPATNGGPTPAPSGPSADGTAGAGKAAPVPRFEFKLMHEFEWVLIHKDGHRVHVEAAAGTIELGDRTMAIGIFCDRSEQERLQDQLRIRTLQQAAVVDLGQRALAGGDLEDLMDRAIHILANTLDVEYARVLELRPDGRGFVPQAGLGWDRATETEANMHLRLLSQAGFTLLSDSPVIVEDFNSETRFPAPLPRVEGGVTSGMSVIIRGQRQPWGVLCVHTGRHRRFTRDDVHFLQAVANVLAESILGKGVREALRRAGDRERELREELEAHSRVVVAAQEAERRRIARELHDEIGQALTGLALSLANLERLAPAGLRASLSEARVGMSELVSRVHDFSLSLRPAMLDDLGLLPALLWLLEHVASIGLRVDLEHSGVDRRFSWEVETAAYRIVQEALNNVTRHAATDRALVRCLLEGDELFIEVRDEGVGFDPGAIVPHTTSGLRGMQERARLLGGRLRVESVPGKGTQVVARLPAIGSQLVGTGAGEAEASEGADHSLGEGTPAYAGAPVAK
jgi:signal transduction histidine kinase